MKQEIYEYSLNETLAIKDEIEKKIILQKFEKEKEEMLELDFYELSCRLETDSLKLLLLHSHVLTRKKRRLIKKLQKLHEKENQLCNSSFIDLEFMQKSINEVTMQIVQVEEELLSLKQKLMQ